METHARSHVVRKRRRYANVFSEEQWGIPNGGIWKYMKWQIRQLCFSRLFKFVWIHVVRRLEKRDHAQPVTEHNMLLIFRVSTKKTWMHTTEEMSFHRKGKVLNHSFRNIALAMKRPRSTPCYASYYFKLWIFHVKGPTLHPISESMGHYFRSDTTQKFEVTETDQNWVNLLSCWIELTCFSCLNFT